MEDYQVILRFKLKALIGQLALRHNLVFQHMAEEWIKLWDLPSQRLNLNPFKKYVDCS